MLHEIVCEHLNPSDDPRRAQPRPALPPDLHLRVARDPELEGKLLRAFSEELEELLHATTKAGERGRGGHVTFLQHFGSALNLHLHFHTLALDGVYLPGKTPEDAPVFVPAPEPTPDQVRWLCDRVVTRARRLIARRPWHEPAEERALPVFKACPELVEGSSARSRGSPAPGGCTRGWRAGTCMPPPRSRPMRGSRSNASVDTPCAGPSPTDG